jgi:hypothetical protein
MNRFIRLTFVGFYVWISAVFFGGIILDVVYARNLEYILSAPDKASFFAGISDFLLYIAFILIIAALVAITLAWKSPAARNFLIASLLVFSLEFWLPILFSTIKITQDLSWLRFVIDGTGSILAFVGLQRYFHVDKTLSLD